MQRQTRSARARFGEMVWILVLPAARTHQVQEGSCSDLLSGSRVWNMHLSYGPFRMGVFAILDAGGKMGENVIRAQSRGAIYG